MARFSPPSPLYRASILRTSSRLTGIGLAAILAFLLALTARPAYAQDGSPEIPTNTYCLSCHGNPELSLTLASGEELSLYVSPDALESSVHRDIGIDCVDCHTNITTYPHPPIEFDTLRELERSYYLACEKCHSDKYEQTLDSVHEQMAISGHPEAPVCTDCHGAHDVPDPDDPPSHVATTCGQCHTEIFEQYQTSVHGESLMTENNPDVPTCTYCHGVHNISDPRTELFRVESPELCAGCHADPELTAKYGLDPDVYNLYRLSWHGVDVSVFQARWPNLWHNSAVCTDCHGIHDIFRTENPQSRVHPTNLLATCQICHEDAPPNWTGAWTGHNDISLDKTPFLFYTQVFYENFAYSVLWISAIYVFLQIIRITIGRIRRSM